MDRNKIWEIAERDYKIQQIKEEWDWLIDNTVGNFQNSKILEIGCYNGGSSYYLSNFAEKMITIDNNDPCRFDPTKLPCCDYTYVAGDSHDPKMNEYFKSEIWDFVFIDGDHSYEGVKADFYNVLPFLKKGTPVAFHDIIISHFHHTHGCYVGEFWRDLKTNYGATKFDEIVTNSEWAGIGIIWI
jgi:predicted O-methyltransferase YrrM